MKKSAGHFDKRLRLVTQTVRVLSAAQLVRIVGSGPGSGASDNCPDTFPSTTNTDSAAPG
jgi:hypothetical protein